MTNNTRRWLLAGAFTVAGVAGAAAYDAATNTAHAADKPPAAVDCPGGAVDRAARLPEKASARAKAVVAHVTADKPQQDEPAEEPTTPPRAPEPTSEPTQEPDPEPTTPAAPAEEPAPAPESTEPSEPPTEPRTTEPAPTAEPTEPVIEVPPVEVPPVVETPPVVVAPTPTTEPIPTPDPLVITLPSDDPAPLPDADAPVNAPKPRVVLVPVPELPVQLPVVIGPTAEHTTEPAATGGEVPGAAVELVDAPPGCADRVRVAIHLDRDLIDQLIDSLTTPAAKPAVKARPGCPDKPEPAPDHIGCTGTTSTSSNTGTNGGPLFADTTTALTLPTLDRLEHARARSTIPASRHVAIEPGPA